LCKTVKVTEEKQPAGQAKLAKISGFLPVKPPGTNDVTPGPYD